MAEVSCPYTLVGTDLIRRAGRDALAGNQYADAIGQRENHVHEWERLNEAFHETLVSACTSEHLLRFRRMVYAFTLRYRRVCLSIRTVTRNVHEEHKQLCDVAIRRDVERIGVIIDSHLERTFAKVAQSGRLK